MQIKPRPCEDLALAIQWQVVRILGSTSTWAMVASVGRPPMIRWMRAGAWVTPSVQVRQAFGQSFGPMAFLPSLRAHGDNHTQLRGHDVQPFGAILADLVHDAAATRADEGGGFDDLLDARQIGRQVADGAFWRGLGRPVGCSGRALFLLRLDLGQRDGQVLKGQLPAAIVARTNGATMACPRSAFLIACHAARGSIRRSDAPCAW